MKISTLISVYQSGLLLFQSIFTLQIIDSYAFHFPIESSSSSCSSHRSLNVNHHINGNHIIPSKKNIWNLGVIRIVFTKDIFSSRKYGIKFKLCAVPSSMMDEILSREGVLQQGANFVQKLYWAQFADDTYTGSLRILKPKTSSKTIRQDMTTNIGNSIKVMDNETNNNEYNDNITLNRPRAPTVTLLPATAIRYLVNDMTRVVNGNVTLTSGKQILSSPSNSVEKLDLLSQLLKDCPESCSTSKIRKAFNTYTASLQFGDSFALNLPPGSIERKRYIQENDSFLNSKTAIVADLDLRDLHRNQILTLFDDINAEIEYQQKRLRLSEQDKIIDPNIVDLEDITEIIGKLQNELDVWFGFIPEKDVEDAYSTFISTLDH